jgi:hypothetical protein
MMDYFLLTWAAWASYIPSFGLMHSEIMGFSSPTDNAVKHFIDINA